MGIKNKFVSEYKTYYSSNLSNSKLSGWINMTLNIVSKEKDVSNLCIVKKFIDN
jgi:hypothetical protein